MHDVSGKRVRTNGMQRHVRRLSADIIGVVVRMVDFGTLRRCITLDKDISDVVVHEYTIRLRTLLQNSRNSIYHLILLCHPCYMAMESANDTGEGAVVVWWSVLLCDDAAFRAANTEFWLQADSYADDDEHHRRWNTFPEVPKLVNHYQMEQMGPIAGLIGPFIRRTVIQTNNLLRTQSITQ